jgi:zinc transport system substrate-binding protein
MVPTSLVQLPGDEATLADVANVGELAREQGVTTMFVEPGPTPDLASSLAEEFGLRLAVLDPLEVLPLTAGAYVDGMRANLDALTAALS